MSKRLRNTLAVGVFLLLTLAVTVVGDIMPPDSMGDVTQTPYYPEEEEMWYEQNAMIGGGEMGDESVVRGRELDIAVESFTTEEGLEGWRVEVPGGRALATPAIGEGLVYIGGGFGSYEFYAFDANNGEA
ncbi:PQQ-binding-like beta-propeller repeat protein, partial [bacterium]|nr:PQQ-binding-like beta-propeller repeat protein [bacterium]